MCNCHSRCCKFLINLTVYKNSKHTVDCIVHCKKYKDDNCHDNDSCHCAKAKAAVRRENHTKSKHYPYDHIQDTSNDGRNKWQYDQPDSRILDLFIFQMYRSAKLSLKVRSGKWYKRQPWIIHSFSFCHVVHSDSAENIVYDRNGQSNQ